MGSDESEFNNMEASSKADDGNWRQRKNLVEEVVAHLEGVSEVIAEIPDINDAKFIDLLNEICRHNHIAIEYATAQSIKDA